MLKDQLRRARKSAGKTQQQVADHLCVNYSTYSGYETGKRQPDALKIRQIADFLGVSGDYLLETGFEHDAEQKNKNDTIVCESPDEIRLIRNFRALSAAGKIAAVSTLEGLAANPDLREGMSSSETA